MSDTALRRRLAYGLPVTWLLVLLASYHELSAVGRLVGATVCLLLVLKVAAWLLLAADGQEESLSRVQTLLFVTIWPGIRPDLFAGAEEHESPTASNFVVGYAFFLGGIGLAVAALLAPPVIGVGGSTWLLLFAFLSTIHFGIGRLLPFGLRWLGYAVPPLFNDPLWSTSVAEFWSDRWNRPFINMNRLFLTRPLSKRFGMGAAAFVAFLVSGIAHELAISYPAGATLGAGLGLPFCYFILQGVCYTVEQRVFPEPDGSRTVLRRLWTMAVVLGPLPLLFHAPFRLTFLAPLIEGGRSIVLAYSLETYLSAGLWIGAAGHFLVLAASYRVPEELDWETDLANLKPLNRKLMWTYGGYIVLSIVTFGVMTAVFHQQFLDGTAVALGLCGFIVVFWTIRVLVDSLYFSHDDWPDGLEYVVGHTMLTSLFLFLILIYGAVIAYNVLG